MSLSFDWIDRVDISLSLQSLWLLCGFFILLSLEMFLQISLLIHVNILCFILFLVPFFFIFLLVFSIKIFCFIPFINSLTHSLYFLSPKQSRILLKTCTAFKNSLLNSKTMADELPLSTRFSESISYPCILFKHSFIFSRRHKQICSGFRQGINE